jgi:hypothetical protein
MVKRLFSSLAILSVIALGTGQKPAHAGFFDSQIYFGPPRNPNTVSTEGGIPGARGLAPGYGYYPDYSHNWPTLREALAQYRHRPCRKLGLAPSGTDTASPSADVSNSAANSLPVLPTPRRVGPP